MEQKALSNISAEVLAAYLDGNATAEESQGILDTLSEDAQLRELLHISQLVDAELGSYYKDCEYIPMTAMAASCEGGAYCCLECEKHILRTFNISFDEEQMIIDAVKNGWHKENGTALHNVGRHLENHGLIVSRRYNCAVDDIADALRSHQGVIVAVDGGELSGCRYEEIKEDILIGQIPDHTVVVLSLDDENITLYDPNSPNSEDVYPVCQFMDAWKDSKNYIVKATPENMNIYNPRPIDLSDVELPEELNELREAIAENAHDVWASERQAQGWTYGTQRDDAKKETPCMVPYSQLPESEKKFDREMAMNTLKLLKKLGYDLVRRN